MTGYLSGLTPGTTYHYRLVAENRLGTTYGYDYTFSTPAAPASDPTASFADYPSAPTPGTVIAFDGRASQPGTGSAISQYTWNFGDGTPQQAGPTATANHTYSSRGTYRVTLTVTDADGQIDTTTQTITVDSPPTAGFTPSATTVAPGTTVNFDGSASAAGAGGSIGDYNWSFGDGGGADTATSPVTSHTYNTPGIYTVTLKTIDDLNVGGTATEQITVAAFTTSPAPPTPGTETTFTATSSTYLGSPITDYTWDFGDGTADTPDTLDTNGTPTAPHTYTSRGTYQVTLTASNGTQTSTSTHTVTVDNPPTASFSAPTAPSTPGSSVHFDGSAAQPGAGGTIDDYSWNFGDGTTSDTETTAAADHVYTAPGTYLATLTVTDDLGLTATSPSQQVTVDEPGAAFTTYPGTPAPGATATFDAGSSIDPAGTISDYSWDFGDGTSGNPDTADTGTTAVAHHPYATRGIYIVSLTTTNNLGQTATSAQHVTVDNPPTAAFTPSPTVSTAGQTVRFDGTASTPGAGGTIERYSWNFGDGSPVQSPGVATAHTYSTSGTYTVTLTTTDDLGVTNSVQHQITVNPAAGLPASTTPPAPVPTPTSPVSAPTAPTPSAPAPSTTTTGKGATPVAAALSMRLAAQKQRLAVVLTHGVSVNLSVNLAERASFQVTFPGRKRAGKPTTVTLLRTGAQAIRAGAHAITLKLSPAQVRRLAAAGPVALTVKVTVTKPGGGTLTRSVKLTLTR